MTKTISLNFNGYWHDVNKEDIPAKSGIYLVYVCRYNEPKELIYIGEAGDVRDRIAKHEKRLLWQMEVPDVPIGSELCYSFAGVTNPDRERAEAALIHYHKPTCNENDKYIDSFPFEGTTVESTGARDLLSSPIIVYKTY